MKWPTILIEQLMLKSFDHYGLVDTIHLLLLSHVIIHLLLSISLTFKHDSIQDREEYDNDEYSNSDIEY